LNHSC